MRSATPVEYWSDKPKQKRLDKSKPTNSYLAAQSSHQPRTSTQQPNLSYDPRAGGDALLVGNHHLP